MTKSDDKVIDRESSKMSLSDRYKAQQKAGGVFNAYKANSNTPGNMLDGLQGELGYTQRSREFTTEPGFKTNSVPMSSENFNQNALNYSDNINGGVKTKGVNKISTNWNGQNSLQDAKYTNDSGFKLNAPLGITQFKDASGGNNSKQLSTYIQGFNNTKYINGKFSR